KASEMYLRNSSPKATCLYSAAAMLPRRAAAIRESWASQPILALAPSACLSPPTAAIFRPALRLPRNGAACPAAPAPGADSPLLYTVFNRLLIILKQELTGRTPQRQPVCPVTGTHGYRDERVAAGAGRPAYAGGRAGGSAGSGGIHLAAPGRARLGEFFECHRPGVVAPGLPLVVDQLEQFAVVDAADVADGRHGARVHLLVDDQSAVVAEDDPAQIHLDL